MPRIIAGRFELQEQAQDVVDELVQAGFAREHVTSFYLNPAGRHDEYPIGGDQAVSPGAKDTGKSVAAGVAAGAAAGVAATPVLGPLGPVTGGLLGAHLGGLAGGLSGMKDEGDAGKNEQDAENAAPARKSGMMVGVEVDDEEQEDRAISLLRSMGGMDIERAEGRIAEGDWSDFNPQSIPELIAEAPGQQRSDPAQRA
ncbi:hypothetical protein [Noviherbaspirillum massiliense]|uniref:hypothetical protein n=1 Tax=Noviherbaspirillum massiliense TaxID=1465823 RepID=UPI00031B1EBA|nr:hypothetical protein [Noviherbaspirillum massiliense]